MLRRWMELERGKKMKEESKEKVVATSDESFNLRKLWMKAAKL